MAKKIKNDEKLKDTVIKDINEDTNQIKKFIIILVCVALVSVLLYFISSQYLVKDGVKETSTTPETINYTNVNVGNVFNRPYDEYYVLAYDPDSLEASYYASLLNNFGNTTEKIYFLNLSLDVNKKYISDVSNKDAKNSSELKLKEPTLIKIKEGKISKYLETREDIDKELNSVNEK